MFDRPDIPFGIIHDSDGRILSYKGRDGYWYEKTYNVDGEVLSYKDAYDDWQEWFVDIGLTVKGRGYTSKIWIQKIP